MVSLVGVSINCARLICFQSIDRSIDRLIQGGVRSQKSEVISNGLATAAAHAQAWAAPQHTPVRDSLSCNPLKWKLTALGGLTLHNISIWAPSHQLTIRSIDRHFIQPTDSNQAKPSQ